MRKTLSFLVFLTVVVVLSAYREKGNNERIEIITSTLIRNNPIDSTEQLNDDKYILLNFWSSAEPDSRIRNIVYSNLVDSLDDIRFASINFDRDKKLFEEILHVDRINSKAQIFDSDGQQSELYEMFHLDDGFNSYLIDREGKIVAINPDKKSLTEFICR